jgi:hypothetical protein
MEIAGSGKAGNLTNGSIFVGYERLRLCRHSGDFWHPAPRAARSVTG